MSNSNHPPRIRGLSEIAGGYRYLLCDAWGVLHNGVTAYADAVDALIHAREAGLTVLVLTNAPRPKAAVVKQFDGFGVDHRGYDDIVTSGDATREYLAARPGTKALFVGTERDRGVFEGIGVTLAGDEEAELIACTGLYDDTTETPEHYDARMRGWIARGLPLICANPDKVVERGHEIVWCAGALAAKYAGMGGETVILGKPYAPIYDIRAPPLRRDRRRSGRSLAGSGGRRRGRDRPPRRQRCRARRALRHRRNPCRAPGRASRAGRRRGGDPARRARARGAGLSSRISHGSGNLPPP